ncbi:MAG: hypothetical protein WAM04_17350 [Candidatus Sulfotelmatobacter sp.]
MKKVMLVVLFALLAVAMAAAQTYIPQTDVLGAHNNGGRGCPACHAPHSGARGNGGTIGATWTGAPVSLGGAEGDYHLWGQDVSLITQENLTFGGGFSGGFAVNFGGGQQWTSTSLPVISGIAICLSCHDGNVSTGAMMTGYSYEGMAGLLPQGNGWYAKSGSIYGPATTTIPTWLGNDGGTLGDYLNDHPVGPAATPTTSTHGGSLASFGLVYTGSGTTMSWTVGGQYQIFMNNYGAPAIGGLVVDATNTVPYVVCTTCHNQHQMNVYEASAAKSGPNFDAIQGNTTGTYETYFFVNSPYNAGAVWTPTKAPSTTQFCRQCHFGGTANEAFGADGIGTAF